MADTNPMNVAKAKTKPTQDTKFETPKFETPKFEMPKFGWPAMEVPAAFREMAEKGVAQTKETYEKFKSVAEETTDLLEDTYATASKGTSDYGLKVIENARANSNATFDLFGELMTAKSYSEMIELTTGFWRAQFETVTAQAKDLTACAQKVATDTAGPLKEGFTSAMRKAA